MEVAKKIIKFILIFFLTVSIILIGIIKILSTTILDKEYVKTKFEDNNFYEEIYQLVETNFQHYIDQSGLNEDILDDICSKEKVKQDIEIILANIYDGANQEIDTTSIAENLDKNIEKLGIRNNENAGAIKQYIIYICQEYTSTIMHTSYENQINKLYISLLNKIEKLNKVCIIVLIIDIVLIIFINNKKIFKNLHEIGIALFSSATFNLIICQIITSKVDIKGIKILNDAFSNILVIIIQEIINKIVSLGVVLLISAVICIVINSIIVSIDVAKDERKIKWKK